MPYGRLRKFSGDFGCWLDERKYELKNISFLMQVETDDGGKTTQTGGSGGEEQVEERKPYLAKETVHDMYGQITEYEYDEQSSLIK